jgi:hypothetical protein
MENKLHILKKYMEQNAVATAPATPEPSVDSVNSESAPAPVQDDTKIRYQHVPRPSIIDSTFIEEDVKKKRRMTLFKRRKAKSEKTTKKSFDNDKCNSADSKKDIAQEIDDPHVISSYEPTLTEMASLLATLAANVDCLRRKAFAKIDPFQKNTSTSCESVFVDRVDCLCCAIVGSVIQKLVQDTQIKAHIFNDKFLEMGKLCDKEDDLKRKILLDKLSALSSQFQKILEDFAAAQEESDRMMDRALKHQVSVVDPEGEMDTEGQLQQMQDRLFINQLDPETLELVQTREEGLKQVEKGIKELRELMVDMAFLMSQQGEVVDTIEKRLESSRSWIGEAKVKLVKARKLRARERRKKFMIFAIIMGGIASMGAFFGLKLAAGTM